MNYVPPIVLLLVLLLLVNLLLFLYVQYNTYLFTKKTVFASQKMAYFYIKFIDLYEEKKNGRADSFILSPLTTSTFPIRIGLPFFLYFF